MELTEEIFDCIVIGGGISGLTAAYSAQKKGKKVLLIEKQTSTGGVIQSENSTFGVIEKGPNSLALTPELKELIKELKLENDIVPSNQAAQRRFIYLNGAPVQITPKTLLFSNKIIGFGSKVKLLTERFKKAEKIPNETLAQAIVRRFNQEILNHLVEPVITGIYAGNPHQLEYESSVKRFYAYEQELGSFTKGFLTAKKSGNKRQIISFKGGLQTLTNALTEHLYYIVHDHVLEVSQHQTFIVKTNEGQFQAKELIYATPAYVTASLASHLAPEISELLQKIEYPSLVGWQVTYQKSDVKNATPSFGILFPSKENKTIKGIINYNAIFGENKEFVHFTVFAGATANNLENIKEKIKNELRDIYQIEADPVDSQYTFYPKAIPQFNVGHQEILDQITAWELEHPNVRFLGNWRTGVAIGDCVNI